MKWCTSFSIKIEVCFLYAAPSSFTHPTHIYWAFMCLAFDSMLGVQRQANNLHMVPDLTKPSVHWGRGTASYEFMRMTSVNRRIWDVSEVHLLGDHFLQQVTSKFISKEWGLLNQNKANCHPRNSPFQKGHRMDSDIQYVHVYKLGINASPTNQFFQKVFQSRVFKFMLLV